MIHAQIRHSGIRPKFHPQVVAMQEQKPRKGPSHATKDGAVPRHGTTESSPLTVGQWNAEGISRKNLDYKKSSPLTVAQWNAEGISRKNLNYKNFSKHIDVVCIQETHLNPEKSFCTRGYETFRLDRQGHKGGIITCVKNSLASTEIERSAENTEYLTIKIFT